MFERSVSKALKDGKIDEWEFNMLQALYYESFDNLSNVDCKMEAETETNLKKVCEEINNLKKELRKEMPKCCALLLCVISLATKMDKLQSIYYQLNHLWKGQKAIKKLRELSKEKRAVIKQ